MNKLYILRHGKAEDVQNHDDFRRRLTAAGEADIQEIAQALMNISAQPDYIISSASARTMETARLIAAFLGVPEKRQLYKQSLYDTTYKAWLEELHKLQKNVSEILLVGHNPVLEVLIRKTSGNTIDLSPGGLAVLRCNCAWEKIISAVSPCTLEGVHYPQRYKKRQPAIVSPSGNCFLKQNHALLAPQNRELSLLSFNARVAQEAADKSNNPIERLTFIGIVSSNLEEFYRVRVGALAAILQKKGSKRSQPAQALSLAVQERVQSMQELMSQLLTEIMQELEDKHDIVFADEKSLNTQQRKAAIQLFEDEVRAGLSVILQPGKKTLQSYMKTDMIYLAARLRDKTGKPCYALVEIPPRRVHRFIPLAIAHPDGGARLRYLRVDDLLRLCLPDYFKSFGYTLECAHCIKITRNAELGEVDMEEKNDAYMYQIYKKREINKIVRLIYDREMPKDVLLYFRRRLDIAAGFSLLPGGRYHNDRDFIGFRPPGNLPGLVPAKIKSLPAKAFNNGQRYFEAVAKNDVLLHFPYHDFRHIVNLLREASLDPSVTHINITLYRVAEFSEIIDALINAAYNGKQITVMMEIKARFNEEDNLRWRRLLIDHGITVLEQIPQKKVHAKVCLIRRKKYPDIVMFSTGNFNEKTARLYCDAALITINKELCADALRFFHLLETPGNTELFNGFHHLLVSPRNMRRQLVELINQEIENAAAGKPAVIYLKLNNLNDPGMTHLLHKAVLKGVRLKLIVRSTFSLNPQLPEYGGRMQAISIVDTLLEHARIFVFSNNGKPQVYLSSADFLTRNLDRRYEVAAPVLDKALQRQLIELLDLQLADNVKARLLNAEQNNLRQTLPGQPKTRAQKSLAKLLQQ